METIPKEIRYYTTEDGTVPFRKWFRSLKDGKAKTRITKRLNKAEDGNLGEIKSVNKGVHEMIIKYGPGYRLYFANDGDTTIVLLCGGDKRTQEKDIKQAQDYWADYKVR